MLHTAFVMLPFAACVPEQEDAPPTLDEFLHTAWQGYAAEDHDLLGSETAALDPTLNDDEFAMRGNFTDISSDELGLVDLEWEPNPADATGFYVVDTVGCTQSQIEFVLTTLEQDEIYSSYTEYERNYTTDGDAFFAGDTDVLYWETTYTVDAVIFRYTMSIVGGVQRIDGYFDEPIYVTRTYAPNPADCEGEDTHFEQDYQIEVFFPRDGSYVHTYAMWRQFGLSADGNQDDEIIHNSILTAMEDYFDNTTEYCSTM